MDRRHTYGPNYRTTNCPLDRRATTATNAIRLRLFMDGSQGNTGRSRSKANACAWKKSNRVVSWLCCAATMLVCQVAFPQSTYNAGAPLAIPQANDSGGSIDQ